MPFVASCLAVLAQTTSAPAQPAPSPQGSIVSMLLMFGTMGLVMYLLILRPQQRRQREREAQLNSVKAGDRVVTTGGIEGVVTRADGDTLRVRIAPSLEITIRRGYIAELPDRTTAAGKDAGKSGKTATGEEAQ